MTNEEKETLYRILFENSDEECPSAIYEVYDTLTELYGDLSNLKMEKETIH